MKLARKNLKKNVKDILTEIPTTNSLTAAKVWLTIVRLLDLTNSKNSKMQETSKLATSISEKNGRRKSKVELKSFNPKKAKQTNKLPRSNSSRKRNNRNLKIKISLMELRS